MFRPVSPKLDVPSLEREQQERWRERDTMARYLVRNEGAERRFSFLDGPITANNPMGVHHAWGRTYKDLYQRYHTMLGERQRYQNGFDAQGLWIEVEVERELGFNNKRQIEEFGIDRFVELCKARVDRFVGDPDRAEQAARDVDGLGSQLHHEQRREQLRHLVVPGRVPSPRAGLQGPRRDALVPALRDRPVEHGDRDRGLPRAAATSR